VARMRFKHLAAYHRHLEKSRTSKRGFSRSFSKALFAWATRDLDPFIPGECGGLSGSRRHSSTTRMYGQREWGARCVDLTDCATRPEGGVP